MNVRLFLTHRPGGPAAAGRPRRPRWAAAAVAVTAAVPLLAGTVPPAPGGGGRAGPAVPRPLPAVRLVPVHRVHGHKVAVPVMHRWRRPPVHWPAAGTVTVTVPAL